MSALRCGSLRSALRRASATLALVALSPAVAATPAPAAPVGRVLLITIDTLRADHVGVYGGPRATPAIDALAEQAVLFTEACTPTPSTGPAHASLFTGRYPWHHGVLDNAVSLDPRDSTLATRLGAAGFATAGFVSSYILHERFGFGRGFATYRFEPSQAYFWRGKRRQRFWTRGAETTEAALDWLAAHREEPWFVWVHYFDPHSPYEPPPDYARAADEPVDLAGKVLPPGIYTKARLARLIRAYRGEVAYADAQVGRLVKGLRRLELLEGTTVILTSDHGEGLGDHGVLEHGVNLFEELVRVPLLIRAPGLAPGRRLAGPVQLEDVAPTILALLEVPVPERLDGRSLLAWARGEAESSPRAAVVGRRKVLPGKPDQFYERRWPHKWIGRIEASGPVGRAYELEADARERVGVPASARPGHLLGALADAARRRAAPQAADEETRRALRALGYLE